MTEGDRDDEHLREIEDGAGCVEIWERLAEWRTADGEGSDRAGDGRAERTEG